jgi:hypothetical protein
MKYVCKYFPITGKTTELFYQEADIDDVGVDKSKKINTRTWLSRILG